MERDRWLGVELRHLAALEAVARTRSFGAAARDLGYTQSAVSQQIAQLERSVGVRLVDRPGGPRQVDLTDAGRLLLRHADAIVAQLDAAKADMAALAEGAAGPLRVGIYQSVGARILPALLRRFREEWPRVEVSVREEIADVTQYFAIERLRFGDALCLDVRIEEDAREVRIPSLIVQPLVENAIRHGLSPATGGTRIGIAASVRDRRLLLRVCDPGGGGEAERNGAEGNGDARAEGFGLRYVRERLRYFYGQDASVTLDASAAGTSVTIDVPLGSRQPGFAK